MKFTVRQLNGYGNVLKARGFLGYAKLIHDAVLDFVNRKITEFELDENDSAENELIEAIKLSEEYMKEVKGKRG